MPDRRRAFVPVLGAGVVAAGAAAYAGSRPWFVDAAADGPTADPLDTIAAAGTMPLATPVALVVLAGWGAAAVTRGGVRRAVAGLTLLGALGLAATVVAAPIVLPDAVSSAVQELSGPRDDVLGSATSAWYVVACVAALACVATSALAVAWCPAWPEMSSRYDAPGAAPAEDPLTEERGNLDLWKQLDQGRDPTA